MSSSPPPANKRRPGAAPSSTRDDAPASLPPAEVDALDPSARHAALAPGRAREILARLRRGAQVASVAALLIGSVVGGRLAHRWVTHTPRFGAREIEVTGTARTTRDEVLAAAHIAPGTNVLGLDALRAEELIEQLPWVEDATVTRRLPGFVRVEVTERSAAAIVAAGPGLYLCAADGTLFKRVRTGDPDDLPLITGIDRAEFERDPDAARENVRDALALLADFGASSLAGRARVEEVHRDATGDLSVVLAERGVYVWLGRGPYRAKLARLSAILAELDRQHIRPAETPLESDRHPERAAVRVHVPAPVAPAEGEGEGASAAAAPASAARANAAGDARGREASDEPRSERNGHGRGQGDAQVNAREGRDGAAARARRRDARARRAP